MSKGFTLIEIVIAIATVSIVSVATMYILFLSLSLRDLTLTSTRTEESLRIFDRYLRLSVLDALAITGGGNTLYLQGESECWSFVYDSVDQNLKYAKTTQTGCTPETNPATLFFPSSTKTTSMNFLITPLSSGGRQVKIDGTLKTTLPLDVYETNFSGVYINLVD